MNSPANSPASDRKLPGGRHHLPPEAVSGHQRSRLVLAVAESVAESGYSALTVRDVLERAEVSRKTFYQQFENIQQCLVAAYREASHRLLREVSEACAEQGGWPDGVLAAVAAALEFAVESPAQARLLATNNACNPALARHTATVRDQLVGLLRSGRHRFPEAPATPELVEQALVAGVISVVAARIDAGQVDRLPQLKPELVQLLLTPYVGGWEAARLAGA